MSEPLPPVTGGARRNYQGPVIVLIVSVFLLALIGVWGYYLLQRNLLSFRVPKQTVRVRENVPSATPSGIPEAVKGLVNSWCGDGIFGTNYIYDPLQKTLKFTVAGGQEITVELLESEAQIEVIKELPDISQIEVRTVAVSELSGVSNSARICVLPKAGPDIEDRTVLFKAEEVEHVYLY